jgi:hypothetical protein
MARTLRGFLLALFLFGAVGVGIELVLLEHFEELWQRLPLALIVVALLILAWRLITRGPKSLQAFQFAMIAMVLSGLIGIWQHYDGNLEFEREMYPDLAGLELVLKALHGAFPALAPGTMIQLGLLGMAYTFRHPGLAGAGSESSTEPGEHE